MEEYIIIYTSYFSEAVIELLDTVDLSVVLLCVDTYEETIRLCRETPNLLGVIMLEYNPKKNSLLAYKDMISILNDIALARKQNMCLSILTNNDVVQKNLAQTNSVGVDIYINKYLVFNTELLKFEGLTTVISNTVGVTNQTRYLTLSSEREEHTRNVGRIELFTFALKIVSAQDEELEGLEVELENNRELSKLIYLRRFADKDEEYLKQSAGTVLESFSRVCIRRRENAGF